MIKKLLALVVCLVVVAALVPGYVGAASPAKEAGLTLEQQYTQATDELQRYLSISETGNIVVTAPNGIVSGINSEIYQTLLLGLEQINLMIDNGYIACNPDFTLAYTSKYEEYVEAFSQYLELGSDAVVEGNVIPMSSTSGGITDSFSYWWGYWIYLSDAHCDAIVNILKWGGTATGVLSFLIFVLGAGIALTALNVGAAFLFAIGFIVIGQCNTNDTGIKIRLNKTFLRLPVPPYIPTWIGAQPAACGTVTGRVTNYDTGAYLSYSTITVKQSGQVIMEGGTDSDGRYSIALSPGTYLVEASHTGFYDLTIPVGVSDGSYSTLNFPLHPSTGGGGCPFLQVWDGSDYVDEGLLNIHDVEGVDVTYEHTLTTMLEPVNGRYAFRLTEHPKTISDIDQVQLHAILEDGTVEELPLRKAWHSEDGNVLYLLRKSDDRRVEELGADHNGGTSQSIDLEFAALRSNANVVAFVFMIEGNNMIIK